MLTLLLALHAHAADLPDPVVEVQDDGSVVGTVHLAVPPEQIRTQMTDPRWLAGIGGGSTTITLEGMDGECQLLAAESPSTIMTAKYWVRRCPTPTGYAVTLRDSNCFKTYGASWDFAEGPHGTIGTYRIALTTSLWVPNSVVRGQTRSAISKLMDKLQDWSENP